MSPPHALYNVTTGGLLATVAINDRRTLLKPPGMQNTVLSKCWAQQFSRVWHYLFVGTWWHHGPDHYGALLVHKAKGTATTTSVLQVVRGITVADYLVMYCIQSVVVMKIINPSFSAG